MKKFLDDTMENLNKSWGREQDTVERLVVQLLRAAEAATKVFGEDAGRKFKDGRFERSLNRAIFEVHAYYFSFKEVREAAASRKRKLVSAFNVRLERSM